MGAVILAGALGARKKEVYSSIPKPMIEVCGTPFIEWVIRYLSMQGLTAFCIFIGCDANVIEKYFKWRQHKGLNSCCVKAACAKAPKRRKGSLLTLILISWPYGGLLAAKLLNAPAEFGTVFCRLVAGGGTHTAPSVE
jgi:hypothetical protein